MQEYQKASRYFPIFCRRVASHALAMVKGARPVFPAALPQTVPLPKRLRPVGLGFANGRRYAIGEGVGASGMVCVGYRAGLDER
jgi:hypothetical protein